jgi:hypothetical protein
MVKQTKQAFNFMVTAFNNSSNPDPRLKKFSLLTLAELVMYLQENYTINNFKKDFAECYLKFEQERIENAESDEESLQDIVLNNYTDAARGDSPPQQKYRFDTLLNYMLDNIIELETKDQQRAFTTEQRLAIYRKNGGVCQGSSCGREVDFGNFHADHIDPHSLGGKTKVSNGQILCSDCNLAKGNVINE